MSAKFLFKLRSYEQNKIEAEQKMYIVTNELETAKHINNEATERLTRRTKDVDEMRKENVS